MSVTDEQIKALRKGDVVTVRAVVSDSSVNRDDSVWLSFKTHDNILGFNLLASEIMTIEPREIAVGDRVRCDNYEGEVKALCDGIAWVRYDRAAGMARTPFMSDTPKDNLTVIP